MHQAPSIVSPDAEPSSPAQNPTRDHLARGNVGLWLAVACALALSLVLQQSRLLTVWRTGGFFDTDDAMRMVQVRDLLAGQGWYDMTQWRLDAPGGVFMHWSRIVDIPLVLLLKFFGLFLAPEQAERAARIAFPTLMFAVLLSGGAWAARIFAGASARVYGVFAILFCGVFFWQFPPGRIDHHAPQITLLFFAVAALARAFDPAQARWAALAGACMAVSLGIGLENMPFFAVIAGAPGLIFVLRGAEARELLRSFAIGLAPTLTVVFLMTVGPRNWFVPACDALSAPWLVGALCGAAAYGALSLLGSLSFAGRIASLGVFGVASLAPIVLYWPICLQPLYAGVDPVVKSLWLDHVGENLTLRQDFAVSPGGALLMALPILIGLCGALFGMLSTSGIARVRWLFLACVVAVGFALGCLCLRVFSSTMPLAALGLLAPVAALRRRLAGRGEALAATASLAALFALSSFGVALALPELKPSAEAENSPDMFWRRPSACLDSASYEPLAGLAPGLAVAPVSAGSYLLAHTHLSVLAAPYHRNNHGNRAALDILRSAPALAESLARKAGVAYVLLCWDAPADVAAYNAMGADSLAAQIVAGQAPGWLRALPVTGTPLHVFTVTPLDD
ncbi:hypothetical protein [Rhodoblastus sp.]|uniref:hypothetical protein n=1 Tax=Rhodoblastus sp. TaxID=1962975 RepID=UPI0025EA4E81|nr:hypothetical protein [Rhodoblastus sp.]